jgi:hypothetical protein
MVVKTTPQWPHHTQEPTLETIIVVGLAIRVSGSVITIITLLITAGSIGHIGMQDSITISLSISTQ